MTRLRRAVARAFTPSRCCLCCEYMSRWSAFLAGQGLPVSDTFHTACAVEAYGEEVVRATD